MKEDLYFISEAWRGTEIPKKYQFLGKYFDTEIQTAFLRYYWLFRSWRNFIDHTGVFCADRYLRQQEKRFLELMAAFESSSGSFDEIHMKKLQALHEGRFRLTK